MKVGSTTFDKSMPGRTCTTKKSVLTAMHLVSKIQITYLFD